MEYIFVLAAGIAIGAAAFYGLSHLGKAQRQQGEISIPSASDIRTVMVESAYEDNTVGREKRLRKAREIVKNQIPIINRIIEKNAKSNKTSALIVEHARKADFDDRFDTSFHMADEEFFLAGQVNAWKPMFVGRDEVDSIIGMVCAMLKHEYEQKHYDVTVGVDADHFGRIYSSVKIDWAASGFHQDNLGKIECESQVDAYKAGVPLEDILA